VLGSAALGEPALPAQAARKPTATVAVRVVMRERKI